MLPPFSLFRPTTLAEALAELTEDMVPYCGGTELLLAMRAGLQRPATLIDLKQLPELSRIYVQSDELVIGATARHMDAAANPLMLSHLPMLAGVEATVGNARVRAQGSIGGNLCFAEPKSDVTTTLIALDARVTLASASGRRNISVENFILGPYYAGKESNELLIDVRVPLREEQRAVYLKYQTRERPTVGVAVVYEVGARRCRVAVGAVGETPMSWTFGGPDEIEADEIAAQIDPTPDLTGSVRYKRHVTAVYIRRAVAELSQIADS